MQKYRIIIYGAGENCESLISYFQRIADILFIVDENKSILGNMINGIEVKSLEQIEHTEYDLMVVSEDQFEQIQNELSMKYNINAAKIAHYRDVIYLCEMNTGDIRLDWEQGITINTLYSKIYERVCEKGNELEKFFFLEKHRALLKWIHYFEIYDRHFSKYKGKEVVILEIGVWGGGSLQMWKNYFGHEARVIGIDINPECKNLEEEQIEIYIGSQEDRVFWQEIKEKVPHIDILLDDGGHFMEQQIITFEEMFDYIADDGIYLCEDLHTSYVEQYNGGYKSENSYIEYSKNFIDYIHGWFSMDSRLKVTEKTRGMHSLHYYTSILVIEKRVMFRPFEMQISESGNERDILLIPSKLIKDTVEEYEEAEAKE